MGPLVVGVFATAFAAPAMVTTTQGEVSWVGEGRNGPAPAAPFLLDDGVELTLADGAQLVVLCDGTAKRLTGPAKVTRASLSGGKAVSGQGKTTSLLDDLLSVQHSQATAGAHRGGVAMTRPVPGGDLLALHEIRWRCADCGEQTVSVVDFLEDETVWTGKGTGKVVYTGPALTGDSYQIAVGGERFTIYLADQGKRSNLGKATEAAAAPMASLKAQGDGVGEASILASLYVHIGLESDALWMADSLVAKHPDEPGYAALAADLERHVLPTP